MHRIFIACLAAFGALSLTIESCTTTNSQTAANTAPAAPEAGFNAYWFQGKAEISTYDVLQERYGETRMAQQVMVFVAEDFSAQKQVKLDDAEQAGADRAPILKLNMIRRFHTGIYDYSLMQSVFTPIDAPQRPHTLKTSSTVQDWCGQVFDQFNLEQTQYRIRRYSYFESEGDSDQHLPLALLEDEIWTRIRLNPASIPQGQVAVIPSAWYARLRHQPFQVEQARISLEKNDAESRLSIVYSSIPRQLTIRYQTAFPHRILSWEERDKSALMSQGVVKTTQLSAYWALHDKASDGLRDSLHLRF